MRRSILGWTRSRFFPIFVPMEERERLEQLFVENLGTIDRAIAALCRRYGIPRHEVDEVASWVKTRLIESDYAALRQFRGESSLRTYLTVVVAMQLRDYRAQKWGRWRPSAAAQRHGALAVRLETLVVRDRVELRQAGEMLRSAGETALSDRELAAILNDLPTREPMRPINVGQDALIGREGAARADDDLWRSESDREHGRVVSQLERAVGQLPPEDQVIVRLRYWQDLSVAEISRMLGIEQKPLYRRLDRALRDLRSFLQAEGISTDAVSFLREQLETEVA